MEDTCLGIPFTVVGLDAGVAAWSHRGRPAELVRDLKYGRATAVVSELAERLATIAPEADLVTWAPASASRRRRRGFDQSELLARAFARRRHLPVRRLLRRADDTAQTSRDLAGRRAGPSLSPAGRRLRPRQTVLVVDDVTTTGATLSTAAEVLRSRGAGSVIGLVVTAVDPAGALQHSTAAASIL